jgi:DNA polymerase (family 10)
LVCAINPDAHQTSELGYFHAGVNIARKGWLAPAQVLNTRSAEAVKEWFGG